MCMHALTLHGVTIVILLVRNPRGSLIGNKTSPEPLPLTPICITVLKVRNKCVYVFACKFVHVYACVRVYIMHVCVCHVCSMCTFVHMYTTEV